MFKKINQIKGAKDKKSFIEKIKIYIRLIEAFSEFTHLKFNKSNNKVDSKTIERLNELQITDKKLNDHKLLTSTLKDNLYQKFNINFSYIKSKKS